MSTTCPVCGFGGLLEPPWTGETASDEICPSCGIHFGYDDAGGGVSARRAEVYADWRLRWIANGKLWFSNARKPPDGWSPDLQLRRVGAL